MTAVTPEQELWRLYRQTRFLAHLPLPEWSESAIITACNPKGVLLSEVENHQRQQQLLKCLQRLGYPCQSIIGASPDLQHQEPSYWVQCDKPQALALTREFQQNALFYLKQDRVWLVPSLLPEVTEQYLATLNEMLIKSE